MLDTPSVTAYKFWPGELGYFCTHAAVFARLVLDGNDLGPHCFIVPIRDPETRKPLPGIDVGDIGAKFGYNQKDNGFLGFKDVRIPRENMLMKYTSVDKDGNYSIEADPKMIYAVLLEGRVDMLKIAGYNLSKGLTIALRYALVRTQFKDMEGSSKE